MSARVFLVAGEASGDALGADLVQALHARDPAIKLGGVGGAAMAAQGIVSQVDTSGLNVLGFIDGLLAYKRVKEAVAATVDAALRFKPDAAVLIDSWGFTLRVAQGLRAADPSIKLVKYIGPQVWATRPGRAKTLAATVDHLICIHDFEVPYYEPYGLSCTVCGHPAVGRFKPGDGAAFRRRFGIGSGEKLVLVLPGSRPAEIRRLGDTFWGAAHHLRRERSDLRLLCVAASTVRDAVIAQAPADALIVDEGDKTDAFAAADVVLAASGTVTTEVALQGAPVIVGYKLGWVTWALARAFLFRSKYASLLNVAAGREIAPEFIQTKFTAAAISAAAQRLLNDPSQRLRQIAEQDAALELMGRGGRPAQDIAADAVMAQISAQPRLSNGR